MISHILETNQSLGSEIFQFYIFGSKWLTHIVRPLVFFGDACDRSRVGKVRRAPSHLSCFKKKNRKIISESYFLKVKLEVMVLKLILLFVMFIIISE